MCAARQANDPIASCNDWEIPREAARSDAGAGVAPHAAMSWWQRARPSFSVVFLLVASGCDKGPAGPFWSPSDETAGPPFCTPGGALFGADTRDDVDFPGVGGTLGMGRCPLVDFGPCGAPLMTGARYRYGVHMMRSTSIAERDWRIESADPEVGHAELASAGSTCGFSVRIETFAAGHLELVAHDGDAPVDRFRLEVVDGETVAVSTYENNGLVVFQATVRGADGVALETPSLRWRLASTEVVAFDDLETSEVEALAEVTGAGALGHVRGEGIAEGWVSHPTGLEASFVLSVPGD